LRCAASVPPALEASLSGLVDRLLTLEQTLRTKEEWARPAQALELVIDGTAIGSSGSSPCLTLPLRISAEAWWALRAGFLREAHADDPAWVVASSAYDGLPLRVWRRPSGGALCSRTADCRVNGSGVR